MATRKGIALTAAIIGGFTAASFLVYLVPSSPEKEVVITYSDPAAELSFAMDRNEAVLMEFELTFGMWKNNELERNEFDERTDLAVEQVNSLVLELRGSKPPEEWAQSYFLYIQALENYKAYFEKTREYVEYASSGDADPEQAEQLQDSISEPLAEAENLVRQSKEALP